MLAKGQLCNCRERLDVDIMGFRETLSKVQDSQDCCEKAWQDVQGAKARVKEAKRRAEDA